MKKGYTLLELILVIAIFSIIISITSINIYNVKKNMENIELNNAANEVKALLSFSKSYCRKNRVQGRILIGLDRQSMTFEVSGSKFPITKKIILSNDIKIGSNFVVSPSNSGSDNHISDEGFIKLAGTITLKHKNNRFIEITISVGNDIIRNKQNDNQEMDIIQ